MTLPLDGLLVMALEQAVAAPFATRQLADLGARVIKVERPGAGDFARHFDRTVEGDSSYFIWLNRGKESVELDVKDPADRVVVDRIVARADVLVQNLAPGAAERLGLDAATVRARHPGLVHCSISGYGPHGPYGQRKAYDLLLQCETGLLLTTGTPEVPSRAGISIADIAAGTYAYSGILAALLQRERTGEGADLHVAMIDALGEWMSQPAYFGAHGGQPPRRTGARHASIAPYGPCSTGDGRQVFLAVQNDREWAALCRHVLGREDLVADPRFRTNTDRVARHDDLIAMLEVALSPLTADEATRRLEAAGIAHARLRGPEELFDHPQLLARRRVRRVSTPAGSVRAVLPPVVDPRYEPRMGAVPALGEHTDAVRSEFAAVPDRPPVNR